MSESSSPSASETDNVTEAELAAMVEQKRQESGVVTANERPNPFAKLREAVEHVCETADAVIAQAHEAEEEAARRRQVASAGERLMRQAGERYKGCRLETFEATTPYQNRVLNMMREYVGSIDVRRRNREGLVLYGPVGTGKDHLAYAVSVTAIVSGLSVWWLNGQSWFGQIRDAIDSAATSEASIIAFVAKPDFAVISDPLPPVGQLSQHQATMLYRAIDARYSAGKPTIVTVNVANDDEADNRMGAPTWDRIGHGAWKVFCNWPSYRKPARELKS